VAGLERVEEIIIIPLSLILAFLLAVPLLLSLLS